MPFINPRELPALEILPGCRTRIPYGQNLMLSYLEIDEGAEVPLHSHPHEQAGDTLYKRPGIVHGCVCRKAGVLLDTFTPQRQDFLQG